MDGGAIVLLIISVMFTAVMVFAVVVRGRARARGWESTSSVTLPPVGLSVRDAADRFSEGQRLLRAGDYQAAVQAFSAAITLDPEQCPAYFRRSEAYHNLGMEEQAKADLEKAKFLMGLAQREGTADITGALSYGCIVGAVVGIAAGLLCSYFAIICMPVFGVAGAILGTIFGGFLGSKVRWFSDGCSAGCVGGCLGGAVGVIAVVGVALLWFWSG